MGSLPVNPSVRSAQDLRQVNAIVVDPRDPKIVFAAGPAGIFRSNDSGLNWQSSSEELGTAAIVALALNPSQPDTLFAATAEGALFRSDDGARTWHAIDATTSP